MAKSNTASSTISRKKVSSIQGDGILPAGTTAPDFTLHVTPDQTLSLSDCAGAL